MSRLNTKAFAFFVQQGASLPTPPNKFIELSEKLIFAPTVKNERFKRYNGKLGANDTYSDTCDIVLEGATINHKMRTQNKAGDALDTVPEYADLMKLIGFTEAIDTTTPNQETVTYTWNTNSAPALGSAVYFLDGKKQTMTNTIAMNGSFEFNVGEPAMLNCSMSAFVDNKGVSTNEANPTVTLSTEDCIMVDCNTIYTEDGTQLQASNLTIDMGAQINKFYGTSLKEYETTDFEPTITAEFYLDDADYNDAINNLINQSTVNISVKIGTDENGNSVSGKTVEFTITNVKFENYSDSDDQDSIKRTHELLLTADSEFSIKTGYFI